MIFFKKEDFFSPSIQNYRFRPVTNAREARASRPWWPFFFLNMQNLCQFQPLPLLKNHTLWDLLTLSYIGPDRLSTFDQDHCKSKVSFHVSRYLA